MVRAKPDCTKQKFGYLTVLGHGGKRPYGNTYTQLWKLQCDCGKVIEKPRRDFDNNKGHEPSCGCQKRLRTIERNQKRAKPDCTGRKFGRLLVLGKGDSHPKHGHLWKLRCDCGNLLSLPRGDFDRIGRGQISCGCLRKLGLVDNKRRPQDITGQKFGNLTAIALTGKKDKYNQPTWLLQCDCGNTCELSLKRLRHKQKQCLWVNCGDRSCHPEIDCWYPATPNPYPKAAGELLTKYLYLTELDYQQIDSAVEDEKRDRLLRACWVITYRRSQGEYFSELGESRFIKKYLRYCSLTVFWQRKLDAQGGLLYDVTGKKREIGNTMTNLTSNDYPVLETQGINCMPIKPIAKLRFKRC